MLKVGDEAPDFSGESSSGGVVRLRELRGRVVVLYFFPKAFTPGCTAQTTRFRDNYAELTALGAQVVGVSTDQATTQCNFARQYDVAFPLLSDPTRTISRQYQVVWPVIGLDRRITYIIDEMGIIRRAFHHEFQVSKHLDDVRSFLEKRRK